jgi:hypothetical protein
MNNENKIKDPADDGPEVEIIRRENQIAYEERLKQESDFFDDGNGKGTTACNFLTKRLKIVGTKLYSLIEVVLSQLFPVKSHLIETIEDAEIWFRYEVSNYPNTDPFRPFCYWDSWAGRLKEKY